jgi:hypothetical protein
VRFVLDNDVPVSVRAMLQRCGHEAWSAHEAGLAEAEDNDLTVYAVERRSVLMSLDAQFMQRRRANAITEPSTALSCFSWHGASTSTWSGGPCTSSSGSVASTGESVEQAAGHQAQRVGGGLDSSSAILPFTWLLPGRQSKARPMGTILRCWALLQAHRIGYVLAVAKTTMFPPPGVRACQDAGHHSGRFWELVVQAPPGAIGDRRLRAPRWPGGRGRF